MNLRKNTLFLVIFLLLVSPLSHAATTVCLEWEVPQGTSVPDFDIALVLGRDRVLYPPNNTTLKIGNNLVAIHEKTSPTDQECIALIDPGALGKYAVGIHHYAKDASSLSFLELYEQKKDGTTKVVGDYKDHFMDNMSGDRRATPRASSRFWVLVPVPTLMEMLAPEPMVENKSEPMAENKPKPMAESKSEPVAAMESPAEEEPKGPDCEPGEGKDLRACDFTGKSFPDGTNFKRANIAGVSFKEARLKKGMFNEADCKGADFSHASLEDSSFVRAECSQANFNKAYLVDVNFKDANLNKTKWRKADIRKANFKRAKLRKANYKEASRDDGANFEDIKK